ncbi:anthranilate synthase component I [Candidatus Methylopumilus universalis]|uniref:Anthranilate synthase component 1 n=1 Tax=Candidatus Methylopumilus universalis TaxID=2588536 RepID=A0ABX5VUU2_9PROT|nr:anthranilate synthase component I [Candidatus Methylopumilus universalis]QDC51593.1 anthranilate synthase component I [Candidatus Methylopumilus universalis]QDC61730.1 anthranilate synthase component I [Candidatus Methylopumilus universalis]
MTTLITSDKFNTYKAEGFNFIPLVKSFDVGHETPLSIYQKLANLPFSYLLESVEGGERFGRYSIIGLPSKKRIVICDDVIEVIDQNQVIEKETTQNPLNFIQNYLSQFKVPHDVELPRFAGGLAGYFGYETIQYIEARLKHKKTKDAIGVPDILLMLSDELIVVDNVAKKIFIVSYADPSIKDAYALSVARLDKLYDQLHQSMKIEPLQTLNLSEAKSEFGEEAFKKAVEKAKSYIFEGDIMQVVLSQRMSQKFEAPPLALYESLRTLNPSPYMFYYHMDDHHVVGASPEILVRLEDETVTVRPIAGTRPRGKTEEEDKKLEKELLADPKERAEHVQLMDLGRNDIGRVSQSGSVKVTDNMTIERYSHVMHIVSNVEGTLKPNMHAMDVLKATFPAGTVSGAPKVRAMEIIHELEPSKRGIYAGAVGYLGFDGDMDVAIAIRTGVIKNKMLYVQAGAGIVADSIPHNEWVETQNKAKAVLRAAEIVQSGK